MPQVSPRKAVRAGVAVTTFLDHPRIGGELRVADAQRTLGCEQEAIARISGRHHAIEHVDAAAHGLDDVLRSAHAHQITGLVDRQQRHREIQRMVALCFRLTYCQATHRIAVKADVHQSSGRTLAQVFVHAALHDAEQRIRVLQVVETATRALGPAQAQLHRITGYLLGSRVRRALVEDHRDVRIQRLLDAHRFLRRQKHLGAVDRRGKRHALLGDLALVRQREHLETTRVGEDGFVPANELVQATELLDDLQPRSQKQMKRVAQDDLGTDFANVPRRHRLDRTIGAHRHERRRLHRAAGKREPAAARGAIGGEEVELEGSHPHIIACLGAMFCPGIFREVCCPPGTA